MYNNAGMAGLTGTAGGAGMAGGALAATGIAVNILWMFLAAFALFAMFLAIGRILPKRDV